MFSSSLLLFSALLSIAACARTHASPSVTIGRATIIGRALPTFQQEFFAGIPYAETPLGPRRLSPPVLKTRLDVDTFNASDYGFSCLQVDAPTEQVSEDCLTLNVLRPAGLPASAYPLPVMFWTYGGGYVSGNSSYFNASFIVAQSVARGTPILYVSFNYRLGPLGFPVGTEAAKHGALNLGLKDQLAALRWVHENIGFFGGDNSKVTLFGESAGSSLTSLLFLNPALQPLARAAIFESGSSATLGIYPPTRNELDWTHFASFIPICSSLPPAHIFDCVRNNATSNDILAATAAAQATSVNLFQWTPVLDGDLIKDLPSNYFARGEFAKIPFIAGTNLDEGTPFVPPSVNSAEALQGLLLGSVLRQDGNISNASSPELQNGVESLLQLYPDDPTLGSPYNTGNDTFGLSSTFKRTAALGRLLFSRNNYVSTSYLQWAIFGSSPCVDNSRKLRLLPVFLPMVTFLTSRNPNCLDFMVVCLPHFVEVSYVYGAPLDPSGASVNLSRTIIDYWVSFATSLTPNDGLGSSRPQWMPYSPTNKSILQFNNANLTMIPDDFRSEQTEFINANTGLWRH
ncbi:Carboxylic ester hydrolase [Mycena indigotica]|uniref:Carboxylic ester hydrolase n=1 Tax=Mycena indigotica TaxID=2126181 RepID=A0A8H6S676_9AGAR|nr:Carboxylic ester hydrolase [Mycena indigotica]KAF7293078.1 Carboxylic ester hydrolase [Mycena indigotica]